MSLEWLLASATEAMLIVAGDGRILLANPAAHRLFGFDPGTLEGVDVDLLVPERMRHAHRAQRAGYADHPRPRQMGAGVELHARHRDGSDFPVEVSLSPLQLPSAEPMVMATVHDIRLRKQAEERNRELMQELRSANEELTNFAYVVSHDLKAPLRGIGSLADWLATDYADQFNDEGKEHMRLLINRVHRMSALIDGILQYSRVGRLREAAQAVAIGPMLAAVIDLQAAPAHIAITVDTPMPVIFAEPTRLEQVFHNLISNAIKYNDKPQGEIHIGCLDQGGEWRFYVRDNGPGIEERHFERIFQLFQTLAARDRVESTGVGLALVKKIVELYRGRVWVESTPGDGSCFWFTLPKTEL